MRTTLTIDDDLAGFHQPLTAENLDQILLPVAGDASDSNDFMRVDIDLLDRQSRPPSVRQVEEIHAVKEVKDARSISRGQAEGIRLCPVLGGTGQFSP